MLIRCSSCNKMFEYEDNMTNCPFCGESIKEDQKPRKQPKKNESSSVTTIKYDAVVGDVKRVASSAVSEVVSSILKVICILFLSLGLFAFFGQAFEGDNYSLFNYAFHPKANVPLGNNQVMEVNYAGITVGLVLYGILALIVIAAIVGFASRNYSALKIAYIVAILLALYLIIYLSVKSVVVYETKDWSGQVTSRLEVRRALGSGSIMLISSLVLSFITGLISDHI